MSVEFIFTNSFNIKIFHILQLQNLFTSSSVVSARYKVAVTGLARMVGTEWRAGQSLTRFCQRPAIERKMFADCGDDEFTVK